MSDAIRRFLGRLHQLQSELTQDLGHSARVYARRPLVTGLAVAALALAIGATTGVFCVVNALLFRSLPFHEPERVVHLMVFSSFCAISTADNGTIATSVYEGGTHARVSSEPAGWVLWRLAR